MECPEVSLLLSEYVDDVLDPVAKALVEAHLASCAGCAEELRSLRAYLDAMAGMEKVRAPSGFLAAVHDRLERPSRLQTIAARLFYPWKVKLPMELAGIALATLLLVFAYQTPRVEKERSPSTVSDKIQELEIRSEKSEGSLDMATVGHSPAAARRVELTLSLSGSRLSENVPGEPAVSAAPALKGKSDSDGVIVHEKMIRQLPEARKIAAPAPPRTPGQGASAASGNSNRAYQRIEESLAALGGVILSADLDAGTDELKTILVRLPAGSYSRFLEDLRRAGRIRETAKEPPETKEASGENEPMEVRIEIIPPQ